MKIKQYNINAILEYIFSLALIISVYSCNSNKLDRTKAKKMIIEKNKYPKILKEQLNYGELFYNRSVQGWSKAEKEEALASQNLITFEYNRQESDMFFTYEVYNLNLTSEGKKYKISQGSTNNGKTFYILKGGENIFGEVTGLKQNGDKSVSVDYTTIIKNVTPFGLILGDNSYYEGQIEKHSAKFIKYDDGWRIED